jgi:hypothetical protein
MAGLENIPEVQNIQIATAKLDEDLFKSILDLQQTSNAFILDFGQIYIRKKEIQDELIKLDEALEKTEEDFKANNFQLREILDNLEDKYPQGRINLTDGTIQYQPGALTRKQMSEQQAQQNTPSNLKVVKE